MKSRLDPALWSDVAYISDALRDDKKKGLFFQRETEFADVK
jgi:hypothetical protein